MIRVCRSNKRQVKSNKTSDGLLVTRYSLPVTRYSSVRKGFIFAFLLGAVFGVIFLLLLGVKLTLPDGKIVSKREVVEKLEKTEAEADRIKLFGKFKEKGEQK